MRVAYLDINQTIYYLEMQRSFHVCVLNVYHEYIRGWLCRNTQQALGNEELHLISHQVIRNK